MAPLQAQRRYRAAEPSAPHRDRLPIGRPSLFAFALSVLIDMPVLFHERHQFLKLLYSFKLQHT